MEKELKSQDSVIDAYYVSLLELLHILDSSKTSEHSSRTGEKQQE